MHEHAECEHELKYCKQCDIVYCEKCSKEWIKKVLYNSGDTWIYHENPPYKISYGTHSHTNS
jgi:hypothetical protein